MEPATSPLESRSLPAHPAHPVHPARGGRRRTPARRALAIGLLVVLAAPVAGGRVLDADRVALRWAPAPGEVSGYALWVSAPGASAGGAPTLRTKAPHATVVPGFGTSIEVHVAATYGEGVLGPVSPASETLHFRRPSVAPFDLDGNGTADAVVVDRRTGELRALLMGAGGIERQASLPALAGRSWDVSGSSDFDGDGRADLLVNDTATGTAQIWTMRGASVASRTELGSRGDGWYARALGDREPGGGSRVLWHDQRSGRTELWEVEDGRVIRQTPGIAMDVGWSVWATCDVDGNGLRDVVWMDADQAQARLWRMNVAGGAVDEALEHPGGPFVVAACAPFGASSRSSVVWQRPDALAFWSYEATSGGAAHGHTVLREIDGARSWVGQAGDVDGDGDADLVSTEPARGLVDVWLLDADAVAKRLQFDLGRPGEWSMASW